MTTVSTLRDLESDYLEGWQRLSPAMRARLGSYGGWKAGYETTLSVHPRASVLRADSHSAVLAVTLRASDLDACGDNSHDVRAERAHTVRSVEHHCAVVFVVGPLPTEALHLLPPDLDCHLNRMYMSSNTAGPENAG